VGKRLPRINDREEFVSYLKSFEAKLSELIESISRERREDTRHEIEAVIQSGASTYRDWLALISNPRADIVFRRTACWVLGEIGNGHAFSAYGHALQDKDPQIRGHAAGALAHLRMHLKHNRNTRIVERLIHAFQMDPDVDVRLQAAFALREFHDPRSLQALIDVVNNRQEPAPVRDVAAEALAYLPDVRVIAPMIEALQDSEEVVRISAAYTLGSLAGAYDHGTLHGPDVAAGLQLALLPLITALRDPSEKVRYWAVSALRDLHDPRSLPELQHVADTDQGTWYGDSVAENAKSAIQAIKEQALT
jgi:HEAT repeat protein